MSSLPSTSTRDAPRREASPIPQKVGEIGYVPPAHGEPEMTQVNLNEPTLPARHPADRDHDSSSSSSSSNPSSSANPTAAAPAPAAAPAAPANGQSQLKKIRAWTLGGIHLWSFIRLFVLLSLMAGTAAAWWYTIKHFRDSMSANQPAQDQAGQGNVVSTYGWSSTVFVHVAFGIVVLFELVFLERKVFQVRAERYMFQHGMAPDARRDARRAATLGIAPWNRPPLPTYAAALAESGHGTGDVEDNLIAIVPPPAYGNTRGSVLLLSSMLPSNLMRSLSRASQRSTSTSTNTNTNTHARARGGPEAEMEEGRRSRPLSYGASEEVDDAARARQLEAALARLDSSSTPRPIPPPPPTASVSPAP